MRTTIFGKHFYFILGIAILSLGVTFFCQREAVFNQYVTQDDANEYIFPFYKIKDPELFKNDIFCEFSLRYNTMGTILIYGVFSTFLDPLIFSKILPFILCCFSAILFFLIGKKISNIYVGFLAAVIFIMHSWTIFCFSGGHARAFSFLLLSGFIYCLLEKRMVMLAVMLFLQVFIYPPIAVISILSLCIILFLRQAKKQKHARIVDTEINFYIFMVVAGAVLLYFLYLQPDDFLGSIFNLKDILIMPEFHSGGRDPHFINSFKSLRDEAVAENIIGLPIYGLPTYFLLGFSCLGVFLMLKRKIVLEPVLNVFCLSGIVLFLISWIMLYRLFSPGRYLKFSLTLYMIFLAASAFYYLVVERFKDKSLPVLFALSMIIVFIYIPFLKKDFVLFNNTQLYNFLSSLPKDVLIAGHPFEMDEIPLFSKRKVLVQQELSLPYYKNYYQTVKKRTNDFFRLYYSDSVYEIRTLCDYYGIDYIVVKKEHFKKEYLGNNRFYIEPFNGIVQRIAENNTMNGFFLAGVGSDKKLYEDEKFFVVKADSI